jgi:hypothetical protein
MEKKTAVKRQTSDLVNTLKKRKCEYTHKNALMPDVIKLNLFIVLNNRFGVLPLPDRAAKDDTFDDICSLISAYVQNKEGRINISKELEKIIKQGEKFCKYKP